MAITREQRDFRAGRLGSSDAGRVMAGDWTALWREKTGRAAPADLDHIAAVQIGIATEPLHPRFVTRATGIACVAAGDTRVHPRHPWLIAHPDFLTWSDASAVGDPDTLVEAKFSGGFASDAELAERYHWQLQHQFLVTGLHRGVLSILRPGGHSLLRVEARPADAARLLATLEAFQWHVANDVEPGDGIPVPAPRLESRRVVDMARHNRFAALAAELAERRPAALAVREAEAALKALMPADARVAFVAGAGQGVYVARSRDGRLSLNYGPPPRRALECAEPWEPAPPPDPGPEPDLHAVLAAGWGAGRNETLV
ncbi:YqaJ viral recombinase family protein [Azospirillum halopraeferens]|uniref:YqaJ viral recombinase family protein n=1 Tax=Azospirillum halopraeferens TaxID=34010 RepID=UPI00040D26A7|nr:YqaJ viral recombinase family protein [Azospirillum halopraeferens]